MRPLIAVVLVVGCGGGSKDTPGQTRQAPQVVGGAESQVDTIRRKQEEARADAAKLEATAATLAELRGRLCGDAKLERSAKKAIVEMEGSVARVRPAVLDVMSEESREGLAAYVAVCRTDTDWGGLANAKTGKRVGTWSVEDGWEPE